QGGFGIVQRRTASFRPEHIEMKVLLDENLPLDLRHFLADHQAYTVAFMKWKGLRNGQLMQQAAKEAFDVLVTRDAGIEHQQNLTNLPIAVVVLPAHAKKLEDLLPLIPSLLRAISQVAPKTLLKL
ncbi:MAG TPA: DUF5615 family PIN-like protein, partial [Tepidisphaeraceae bacterium]